MSLLEPEQLPLRSSRGNIKPESLACGRVLTLPRAQMEPIRKIDDLIPSITHVINGRTEFQI
jgi:hypothetical protein